MQLKHRVALDGVQLDEIDDRIMIQKIETGDGKENISTVSLAGDSGSRVTGIHRDSIDITVRFCLKLRKTEMADREAILEAVNAWAFGGGWLETNYKENRRIRVFRAQAAGAGDPWEWTKVYAIVFRACGVPYWQEKDPQTVMRLNTRSEIMTLGVNGSAKSAVEATFQNTSGSTVNTFSLSTGESQMAFTGLGLANGESLIIDHEDTGERCLLRLRIKNGNSYRSVLNKRTPESSDDLTVSPGVHQIQMTAGGNGKITVSASGRFA
jgi:hypothetical protein